MLDRNYLRQLDDDALVAAVRDRQFPTELEIVLAEQLDAAIHEVPKLEKLTDDLQAKVDDLEAGAEASTTEIESLKDQALYLEQELAAARATITNLTTAEDLV